MDTNFDQNYALPDVEEHMEHMLRLALDRITEKMSFMEGATGRINLVADHEVSSPALAGDDFFYNPDYMAEKNADDDNNLVRIMLHALWHTVLVHDFGATRVNEDLWNLACDIAVENLILELGETEFPLFEDSRILPILSRLKRDTTAMTADRIYRYFLYNPPSPVDLIEYEELFVRDGHADRLIRKSKDTNEAEWTKIVDRIKIELKLFSKSNAGAESLIENLEEATKPRYDYRRLLENFCQDTGTIMVSEDEFDYVYYTFGLTLYDGMPFIEPLELTKERNVRDFAIVLDTSEKCRVDIIQQFLIKTGFLMKNVDRYSESIALHIIRCDEGEPYETVIRKKSELDVFLPQLKAGGSGGDFRPAFEYVEKLVREKAFTDFRGVIYFSDGKGIFPGGSPGFECIVAFYLDGWELPPVPWWATPILLDEDALQL